MRLVQPRFDDRAPRRQNADNVSDETHAFKKMALKAHVSVEEGDIRVMFAESNINGFSKCDL
jgi:hypothetical protein